MSSKQFFYFLFFLSTLFKGDSCFASHAFGASLTFFSSSSNTYTIEYTLYRDCTGIQAPDSVQIDITDSCAFGARSLFIQKFGIGSALESTCTTDPVTTCNGGTFIGVQKWTYRGTVTLAGSCKYYLSHAESARSNSLTTLQTTNVNVFVYCMINTSVSGNQSPLFVGEPNLYTCIGHTFIIDPQISDADGDSMAMQLINPLTNSGTAVSYYAGYTSAQPLISSPLISLNSTTGILTGKPQQSDVSCYALQVNEYRNGVLISQVERDLTLQARSCNIVPNFLGFNGTPGNYTVTVPPNSQSCFFIPSYDGESYSQTTISQTSTFSGLTFSHAGVGYDTALVCWTPSPSDTLGNPHCFTLRVDDNGCPYTESRLRNFCINVSNVNAIENPSQAGIKLFPNPAIEMLKVQGEVKENSFYLITDIQGRVVSIGKIFSDREITIQNIDEGIYSFQLLSTNKQVYFRAIFIKK